MAMTSGDIIAAGTSSIWSSHSLLVAASEEVPIADGAAVAISGGGSSVAAAAAAATAPAPDGDNDEDKEDSSDPVDQLLLSLVNTTGSSATTTTSVAAVAAAGAGSAPNSHNDDSNKKKGSDPVDQLLRSLVDTTRSSAATTSVSDDIPTGTAARTPTRDVGNSNVAHSASCTGETSSQVSSTTATITPSPRSNCKTLKKRATNDDSDTNPPTSTTPKKKRPPREPSIPIEEFVQRREWTMVGLRVKRLKSLDRIGAILRRCLFPEEEVRVSASPLFFRYRRTAFHHHNSNNDGWNRREFEDEDEIEDDDDEDDDNDNDPPNEGGASVTRNNNNDRSDENGGQTNDTNVAASLSTSSEDECPEEVLKQIFQHVKKVKELKYKRDLEALRRKCIIERLKRKRVALASNRLRARAREIRRARAAHRRRARAAAANAAAAAVAAADNQGPIDNNAAAAVREVAVVVENDVPVAAGRGENDANAIAPEGAEGGDNDDQRDNGNGNDVAVGVEAAAALANNDDPAPAAGANDVRRESRARPRIILAGAGERGRRELIILDDDEDDADDDDDNSSSVVSDEESAALHLLDGEAEIFRWSSDDDNDADDDVLPLEEARQRQNNVGRRTIGNGNNDDDNNDNEEDYGCFCGQCGLSKYTVYPDPLLKLQRRDDDETESGNFESRVAKVVFGDGLDYDSCSGYSYGLGGGSSNHYYRSSMWSNYRHDFPWSKFCARASLRRIQFVLEQLKDVFGLCPTHSDLQSGIGRIWTRFIYRGSFERARSFFHRIHCLEDISLRTIMSKTSYLASHKEFAIAYKKIKYLMNLYIEERRLWNTKIVEASTDEQIVKKLRLEASDKGINYLGTDVLLSDLIQSGAPLIIIWFWLKLHPEEASQMDCNGKLPLHYAVYYRGDNPISCHHRHSMWGDLHDHSKKLLMPPPSALAKLKKKKQSRSITTNTNDNTSAFSTSWRGVGYNSTNESGGGDGIPLDVSSIDGLTNPENCRSMCIQFLLHCHPAAASISDPETGHLPLTVLLQNCAGGLKCSLSSFHHSSTKECVHLHHVMPLLRASAKAAAAGRGDVLSTRDVKTKLYPFMMVQYATMDVAYWLLRENPMVLQPFIVETNYERHLKRKLSCLEERVKELERQLKIAKQSK